MIGVSIYIFIPDSHFSNTSIMLDFWDASLVSLVAVQRKPRLTVWQDAR